MDRLRAGAAGDVQHHQQLHQVVVHRRRERLHDEHLAGADARAELDVQVVVAELGDGHAVERDAEQLGDVGGERAVRAAREEAHLTGVDHLGNHGGGKISEKTESRSQNPEFRRQKTEAGSQKVDRRPPFGTTGRDDRTRSRTDRPSRIVSLANIIGRTITSMADSLTPAAGDTGGGRTTLFGTLAAHVGARRAAWLVAGGLAVVATSAWFNRGFLSYDEHFQILEFAWYKLGRAPAETLAWEFREQMRPGLQPLDGGLGRARGRGRRRTLALRPGLSPEAGVGPAGSLGVAGGGGPRAARDSKRAAEGRARRRQPVPVVPALRPRSILRGQLGRDPVLRGAVRRDGLRWRAGASDRATAARDGRRWPPGPIAAAAAAGLLWGFAFYFRYQIGFSIAGAGCWLLFVRRARLAVAGRAGPVVPGGVRGERAGRPVALRRLGVHALRVRPGEPDRGQGGQLRAGAVVVLRRPDAAVPPSPVQRRSGRPAGGRRLVSTAGTS